MVSSFFAFSREEKLPHYNNAWFYVSFPSASLSLAQYFSLKFGDKFETKILGEKKKTRCDAKKRSETAKQQFLKRQLVGFFPRTSAKNRTSKLMIHVRVTKKKDPIENWWDFIGNSLIRSQIKYLSIT